MKRASVPHALVITPATKHDARPASRRCAEHWPHEIAADDVTFRRLGPFLGDASNGRDAQAILGNRFRELVAPSQERPPRHITPSGRPECQAPTRRFTCTHNRPATLRELPPCYRHASSFGWHAKPCHASRSGLLRHCDDRLRVLEQPGHRYREERHVGDRSSRSACAPTECRASPIPARTSGALPGALATLPHSSPRRRRATSFNPEELLLRQSPRRVASSRQ